MDTNSDGSPANESDSQICFERCLETEVNIIKMTTTKKTTDHAASITVIASSSFSTGEKKKARQ